GNLENKGSDLPTLSDERVVHVNPFRREILAQLAVGERSADLLCPPPCVLDGVGVDHLIGSPVCLAIRLIVSGEIDTSGGDPTDRQVLAGQPSWQGARSIQPRAGCRR